MTESGMNVMLKKQKTCKSTQALSIYTEVYTIEETEAHIGLSEVQL